MRMMRSLTRPSLFTLQFHSTGLCRNPSALTAARFASSSFEAPRISLLTELPNVPGALYNILGYFWKYDVNLNHIESRPTNSRGADSFQIYFDFNGHVGEPKIDQLISEIRKKSQNTLILDEKEVPWFPRHINDLDNFANRVLDAGTDLEADHPGFHDPVYRTRRTELASIAMNYKQGTPIPHIHYTADEIATWGAVYDRLTDLHEKYACSEYLHSLALMRRYCGYSNTRVPQAQDISEFLQRQTGFRLRPVAGLLSSRDFLNGLAFRVFFSTQYIRHHSKPLYTPEPDICHELLGHAPMFADADFADFSQEIGLASLGASDEEIKKLAACYWHSVEFGLVKQGNTIKAYGAGLLSSFGELEYSCSPDRPAGGTDNRPELRNWDPKEAGVTEFPITTYQPIYFVAQSLGDAKERMRNYCEHLKKPFHARYNPLTSTVWVDRAVKFRP